jgi:hypothetical protein
LGAEAVAEVDSAGSILKDFLGFDTAVLLRDLRYSWAVVIELFRILALRVQFDASELGSRVGRFSLRWGLHVTEDFQINFKGRSEL